MDGEVTDMSPEEYAELQQVFLKLRSLDNKERAAILNKGVSLNDAQLQMLKQLLDADDRTEAFLDTPLKSLGNFESSQFELPDGSDADTAIADARSSSAQDPMNDQTFDLAAGGLEVSNSIGPYRILQKIGEGGHGVVYMAEQKEPIRRKVALKLVKPGMQSKMILARFEAERQALALMKHPSIANVIDAGENSNGCPYFVMELVHGIPIDQFCRDNEFNVRQTLELFQQVCEAVHHAHRKGIIHRDLKPANILVTVDSGKPLAKVIDFGIAKAMHLTLTDKTMFTEYGQIVGTLEYMSPEQALMSQDEADVRSDVYSLGVLLYLLLTGAKPITRETLLAQGLFELKNVLNEFQPATPSLKLSGENTPQLWKVRSEADRKSWLSDLRGDLDWITMKALAKDQNQRYDSAAAFSEDIDCFLGGAPVVARPPSRWYTASKWMRRNWVATTLLACFCATLLTSFTAVTWGFYKSQQNLADVKAAEKLIGQKATLLESSLKETEQQRRRANKNARNLAKRLKKEILQSAWSDALDGDSEKAANQLSQIAKGDRDYVWSFVDAVREQMDWPSLRNEDRGGIRQLAIHAESGRVAVVTTDSRLEVWSLRERELEKEIQLENALYSLAEFSDDGTRLLLGAEAWLVSLQLSDESVSSKLFHGKGGTRDAVYDANNRGWLLTTGANFLIRVDEADFKVQQIKRLPSRIDHLASSPNLNLLSIAALTGEVFLVDLESLEIVCTIRGSRSRVVDFHWRRNELVAVNANAAWLTLKLPEGGNALDETSVFQTKEPIKEVTGTPYSAVSIFGDSGVLIADRKGEVALIDRESAISIRQYSPAVLGLYPLQESKCVLVEHFNGRINLVSSQDIDCRRAYAGQFRDITDGISLSKELASVTAHIDGRIQKWHTNTGSRIQGRKVHGSDILSIDVDEATNRIVSVGTDWKIRLTDTKTFEFKSAMDVGMGVRQVLFSNSGRLLAGAPDRGNKKQLREGSIDIWDVAERKSLRRLVGHSNWVTHLQFSSNDERLYSLGLDGTIRVWSVEGGELLLTLDFANESPVAHFATLEEQKQIICGHNDGSLSLRSLENGEVLRSRHVLPNSVGQLFVPQGSKTAFLATSNSPVLTCVDTSSLETLAEFDAGTGNIKGIRADRQWKQVQILGESGVARIWKLPTWNPRHVSDTEQKDER